MKEIIKNFLFVLGRFKTSSVLNLLGLTAAIFIFLIIAIQLNYDLTFNTSIDKHEDIFQLTKKQITSADETYINTLTITEGDIITNNFPEVKNYCYVISNGYRKEPVVLKGQGTKDVEYMEFKMFVTEGFIEMFSPQIIEGSIADFCTATGNTMISQSTAKRIFGDKSPIGEVVELGSFDILTRKNKNGGVIGVNVVPVYKTFTIKAVYKDYADNTSVNNGFIAHVPAMEFWAYNEFYLEIDKEQAPVLSEKMNSKEILDQFDFLALKTDGEHNLDIEKSNSLELMPIKNIQINYPTISRKGQEKNNIYFLISIGLFSLIIAYINFINFTTAMAPARVRSINIKQILGREKSKIRFEIACEALMFTICAFILAVLCVEMFGRSDLAQLLTADTSLSKHVGLLAKIFLALGAVSLLVGIYPALYITNFNPVMALSSRNSLGVRSSKLRNALVVVQLFVAICFIIIAFFVKNQHAYMVNYNQGFAKENILVLSTISRNKSMLNSDIKSLTDEIMRSPLIKDYAASNQVMGEEGGSTSTLTDSRGKAFAFNTMLISDDFLEFFNIPIAEGTSVSGEQLGARRKSVANEQFLKRHQIENGVQGICDEPLIKERTTMDFVGIVKDFNYQPLFYPIGSLVLIRQELNDLPILYFRSTEGNILEARKHIEKTWEKFSNQDINLRFLDSYLEQHYQNQENLSKAISVVSLIIILIAVMGIYGLITFQARYRTKEIAIRKVNGATVNEILYILNRGIFIQFLLASLVAVPTTYYVLNLWLKHFPYKIHLGIWGFLVGLLLVMVITVVTISIQSYKAATANPVNSLKSE